MLRISDVKTVVELTSSLFAGKNEPKEAASMMAGTDIARVATC